MLLHGLQLSTVGDAGLQYEVERDGRAHRERVSRTSRQGGRPVNEADIAIFVRRGCPLDATGKQG